MEEKIRLAVFGQKRLSREGGIEIVVKELCTRMAQNGCDVTCYNRAGHHVSGAEYDKTIEYDGIRQKVVPTIEKKGLAAVSSSFFAALYSAFGRYDVVHIHAEGPAFFCWIPKLFGKRVISTIHGLDWAREKWKFGVGSKFIRQGEKNAVKYADEIIVLSKGVQKYFMETYGRETHFIPNGVNRPEVREAKLITDHFGLEKDSYILFLGRLVPEKGIRYLVEAFKNVKTDKKLVIAGGSSDTDSFMEELKELAKGDDRILFTGFVQGAMLDELYSNAYIYTLPSDLEGMPLSLLEAMSYGNCCLVSDIPECAEVVEDKALIFKKSNIWEPETLPKDIRLINSHYDDLYRIPDGGVVQVDYPDGRSFTARLEHLDDYHFDMGGLGNVFHICQFAEVMERNHADFYPEIQTQDEQAAWELGGKGYLAIQSCEDGWDYTIYHSDFSVMDGGQLDAPELTIQEACEQILEAHHMEKGRRLLQDYDAVMDKVAEAEELSADHRPSTLEKLAELASDTSAPKSSARSAPEL